MKGKLTYGAIGAALLLSLSGRLSAKPETFGETLKWVEKHRAELRAEWHSTEGPVKWQPDDFQTYSATKDWYWDRTIKWTSDSECPIFSKALDKDGEGYFITRVVTHVGSVTDISEQEAMQDASYTRTAVATYTWRLRVPQILPEAVVMDYKEYLQKTEQADNRTVDGGTYYYICILPSPNADVDAIVESEDDQKVIDSRGPVSVTKGYKRPVSFAAIATVRDKKTADDLATAVSHLISLLQAQKKPKGPI